MKKIALFLLLNGTFIAAHAQLGSEYYSWIKKANAYYQNKQYRQSADAYTNAFIAGGGKGEISDRYNAACTWALAGNNDSAFFQLDRIITKASYSGYDFLINDKDLTVLHKDNRWQTTCNRVKQNKEKEEAHLDKKLVAKLDTIMTDDQSERVKFDSVINKFGNRSTEIQQLASEMNRKDSINVVKVIAILEKYGWPGPEKIGRKGSSTIFYVLQHADTAVQEKYFPMVREAAKAKKIQPDMLALMEDRVALRHGQKQIYGSQIGFDESGRPEVSPLEDPDNVDKRRAAVGLGTMAEYAELFGIKWDVEEYKRKQAQISN